MNVLHQAARYAAGDARVRRELVADYNKRERLQLQPAALRLVLAVAAVEEWAGRTARGREVRELAGIDRATEGQQAKECEAAGLIIREGRTGLRLAPAGRDVANDFARRMKRHLEAVEAMIEERSA